MCIGVVGMYLLFEWLVIYLLVWFDLCKIVGVFVLFGCCIDGLCDCIDLVVD